MIGEEKNPVSYKGNISELCIYRSLRINLLLTVLITSFCVLSVYQIVFSLKYMPGDIFYNTYAFSFAGLVGSLSGGSVLGCVGLKKLFLIGFSMASIGSFLLIFYSDAGNLTAVFLLLMTFGYAFSFLGCYMGVALLFPTVLKSSTMGIVNFFARMAGIFAPVVAEVRPPINLIVLVAATVSGGILSQCLILQGKEV